MLDQLKITKYRPTYQSIYISYIYNWLTVAVQYTNYIPTFQKRDGVARVMGIPASSMYYLDYEYPVTYTKCIFYNMAQLFIL